MSEDEVKEVEAEEIGALPNIDDAFETEDVLLEDDLGVVIPDEDEEDDIDADLLMEDRDGNY
jgi:hypothetical protein